MMVATVAIELENLNAVGIIGSKSGRDQAVALNHQTQGRHCYNSRNTESNQLSECYNLQGLVALTIDHGVPRSDINRTPTEFLLNHVSGRVLGQVNKFNLNNKIIIDCLRQSVPRFEPAHRPRTP